MTSRRMSRAAVAIGAGLGAAMVLGVAVAAVLFTQLGAALFEEMLYRPRPVGTLTAEEAEECMNNSNYGGQILTHIEDPALEAWARANEGRFPNPWDRGLTEAALNAYYRGRAELPADIAADQDARCRDALRSLLLRQTTPILVANVVNSLAGANRSAALPPAGTVWFGKTLDTDTFELAGRTSWVDTSEAFAMVGVLPRTLKASEMLIRAYLDGQMVLMQAARRASGAGDVWGFSYRSLNVAGTWTFEIADTGGKVLASGDLIAAE